MNALVLGATGQLGANLVRALLANGDQVRVLVRSALSAAQASRHHLALQGISVERAEGDLEDVESLHRACSGMQIVYHCAGYYPLHTISVGLAIKQALTQTNHVLDAVRTSGIERLVFASTLTTIGRPTQPGRLADETCKFATVYSRNPYLLAKIRMEDTILEAAREGVPAVIVNPTAFYGPYDGRPTSGMQILLIARKLAPAYVPGKINVIDVRDVACGMIRAAERGRIGERYILGNWNTTQKELSGVIARVAGVRAPSFPVPFTVARWGSKSIDWLSRTLLRRTAPVPGFFVEMLAHMQHYDCSKAIAELDYPRRPVEDAIRDAVAWFRAHGYLA